MSQQTALITGITGQDGSYLAELLLEKEYQVIGLVSSQYNIGYDNVESFKDKLILEDGDLLDVASLKRVFEKYSIQEVYNLAGMTYVPPSWKQPTLTLDVNTLGLARILELVTQTYKDTKVYQASSSKIFGDSTVSPQNELTPLQPLDPYSISKTSAHQLIQAMRTHFGIFAVSGILFNHESERRGPDFVTRKITQAAAKIKLGLETQLELGDLDAQQDWGYAPDYVRAMWLMMQQENPQDYVIATGMAHSVRDVCQVAFEALDLNYQDYVTINHAFVRKEKVRTPLGDASKAKAELGWEPVVSFEEMIQKMVEYDLHLIQS